jgi:hypothetical protein
VKNAKEKSESLNPDSLIDDKKLYLMSNQAVTMSKNQQMSYNDDMAILTHIKFLTIASNVFGVFLFKRHNLLFFHQSKNSKRFFPKQNTSRILKHIKHILDFSGGIKYRFNRCRYLFRGGGKVLGSAVYLTDNLMQVVCTT